MISSSFGFGPLGEKFFPAVWPSGNSAIFLSNKSYRFLSALFTFNKLFWQSAKTAFKSLPFTNKSKRKSFDSNILSVVPKIN